MLHLQDCMWWKIPEISIATSLQPPTHAFCCLVTHPTPTHGIASLSQQRNDTEELEEKVLTV